ncbi:MAG TPA: flagellar basal-body MS-ring/collar protein FliF [Candidatus Megaira endosymbiont of Hartmannula sinica]|nr:flagellar basal-body MS-ring/collar protein FliF [Candidatus Megaera endosymbiont of Hartmannula sinica]
MNQLLTFNKNIDIKNKKIIFASVIGITFSMILFFAIINSTNENYIILYKDLSPNDTNNISQELDNNSISHNLSSDGSTIYVNKNKVNAARIVLAKAGLPSRESNIGYELFDKEDSIGTTNFAQNIKLIRALEGELNRTILSFNKVKKSRVHLVIPQKQIFSSKQTKPKASVVISTVYNQKLSKEEINAIDHLMITAVPELTSENVNIVDTSGKILKSGDEDNSDEYSSNGSQSEIKKENEKRIVTVIENIISKITGEDKVKASVNLDMNLIK